MQTPCTLAASFLPKSKAAGRSQRKPSAHAFGQRSQKPAANKVFKT